MPSMDEIYDRHAKQYHKLVCAEDYENNLAKLLHEEVQWHGARVLEAGTGTGRVTSIYIEKAEYAICCDRSQHMLDHARSELLPYQEKLEYVIAENTGLPDLGRDVDVFIEGWSFGHTVSEGESATDIEAITCSLVANATKNLKHSGTVILIETLGTNVDHPEPPNSTLSLFYSELELAHQFRRRVVRTDYRFSSNEEAVRVMGFFFGADRVPDIRDRGSGIIPEWTGVWIKTV